MGRSRGEERVYSWKMEIDRACLISAPLKPQLRSTFFIIRINEHLRFLRYEKGGYFRPHCDGQLELPDGRKSRVTFQIYLGEVGLEGGATRIMDTDSRYIDVLPKKGRVLIFQQARIYHSGEEV